MAGTKTQKKAAAKKPKRSPGRRLTAAQQATRDTLMMTRQAQGWPWGAIAAEADISVQQAKRAVKNRQAEAPLILNLDPIRIVEDVARGYQLSIGDLEAMAAAYAEGNPAAAVGAKKGANDAREKLLALLQATGRLPHDLGALRHLLDLRQIAQEMLDAMDEFEEKARKARKKGEVQAAARDVAQTFRDLIGLDEEPAELEPAR